MFRSCFSTHKTATGKLTMVGVFLKNSIGSGMGPALVHADRESLRKVKLPHHEATERLKAFREAGGVSECWIWNTCNRFCVYALHDRSASEIRRQITETFFGPLADTPQILNTLQDREAIHHLVRTIAGLNSGLPGETDVRQQLESAIRLAECLGTVGERGLALIRDVVAKADDARALSAWGDFSPSYCLAAMEGVFHCVDRERVLAGEVVVVGSSNTSRTSIEHLARDFKVDPKRITFFHRCHKSNGQLKMLRRAVHGCRRRRVESYRGAEVHEAISRATLVIYGMDSAEPVLSAEELRDLRKQAQGPLVILDFNTLGSTTGIESSGNVACFGAHHLEIAVQEHAERMQREPRFWEAVNEVESLIAAWVTQPTGAPCSPAAPFPNLALLPIAEAPEYSLSTP